MFRLWYNICVLIFFKAQNESRAIKLKYIFLLCKTAESTDPVRLHADGDTALGKILHTGRIGYFADSNCADFFDFYGNLGDAALRAVSDCSLPDSVSDRENSSFICIAPGNPNDPQVLSLIDSEFIAPVTEALDGSGTGYVLTVVFYSIPGSEQFPHSFISYRSDESEEVTETYRPTNYDGFESLEAAVYNGTVCINRENEKHDGGSQPFSARIFDWYELFAYAIGFVLIVMSLFIRHSPVEGSSMYPTLIGNQSSGVTVDTSTDKYDVLLISNIGSASYGDIVIIQEPTQPTEPIVKRIIAMGGDTVKINFATGEVWLNGALLKEDYVNEDTNTNIPRENLTPDENYCWEGNVPEGCVFVLGDNRGVSKDSRYFGFIDERRIVGKAVFRILPLGRFGKIE